MKQDDIQRWKKQVEVTKKHMKRHHALWEKLLNAYRLQYEIEGMDDEDVIHYSSFVKNVRLITAGIAFNYPSAFLKVEDIPKDPNSGERFENISETLQRAGNDILNKVDAKPEVHQCIFNALFKYRGILKINTTPEAPGQATAPYVFNDIHEADFVSVESVPTENFYIDPIRKVSRQGSARYCFEEIMVPIEFAKKDERFVNRSKLKPYNGPDKQDRLGQMTFALEDQPLWSEEEKDTIGELLQIGEYILLTEIHDRVHRRRITFANDVEQPVEDVEHPFAFRVADMVSNPLTGLMEFSGQSEPSAEGFIVKNGFPYFEMTFDPSDKLWGVPIMGYQNDLQRTIVESLTRRLDIIERGKVIVRVSKGAKVANPELPGNLKSAADMEVIEAEAGDIDTIVLGEVPRDSERLEQDARSYAAELIDVGMPNTDSATEAAGFMSISEINRKWLQTPVQDAYSWIIETSFSIFSDPRYTPEAWLVNVGTEEKPVEQALQNWWLQGRHRVEIQTGSASILVEQLNRNDTLQLASWLDRRPEIDQRQLVEMVIDAFGKTDAHDLFRQDLNADAIAAARMEHQVIMQGQMPQVLRGMDHETHLNQHTQFVQELQQMLSVQSAQATQMGQAAAQAAAQAASQGPRAAAQAAVAQIGQQAAQIPPQAIQLLQEHIGLHTQVIQETASRLGSRGQPLSQAAAADQPTSIETAVESSAQRLSNTVQLTTAQGE